MARNKYGQTFQDAADANRPAVLAKRKAAQAKFQRDKAKGGLQAYDSAAKGGKRFDNEDIRYLKNQGYKNKDIQAYARGLGADGLSEELKLTRKAFSGDAYKGGNQVDKITDYKPGQGFNMADVRELRRQGFNDKKIAQYANSQVKDRGKSHGNSMSKFMEGQGMLDYSYGDMKKTKAKEKAQAFTRASHAYFADAQKRSGIKHNTAANLKALYEKQTKGLDPELAFKALDGGRMFGESDMARYKKLLAEKKKNEKKNQPVKMPTIYPDKGLENVGNVENVGNINGDGNMGGIGNKNTDASFNTGDIDANIGKQGDMTTTITNSQFGAGASVGNDYSITLGNMQFGNSGAGGVDVGSKANPLSNMQAATAYSALNDNFLARSKSQLSGYGRAAGAIEEARKANSRPNKDQEAAFRFAGANQNYLRDRVSQIRDNYMGSIEGYQAPSFTMPISPRPVDLDPAKDIYEGAMKRLK